jgi:hypothetical protein
VKYRARVTEIDAHPFNPNRPDDVIRFCLKYHAAARSVNAGEITFYCERTNSWPKIAPGDVVIADSDGRGVYPCKGDVFERKYYPA